MENALQRNIATTKKLTTKNAVCCFFVHLNDLSVCFVLFYSVCSSSGMLDLSLWFFVHFPSHLAVNL